MKAYVNVKNDLNLYKKMENGFLVEDGLQLNKFGYATVVCHHCGKRFVPNKKIVEGRLRFIKGFKRGEKHFYCSEDCRNKCE